MQRLSFELRLDGVDDFRVPVPDVEDAEAAEAIDVLVAVDVAVTVRTGVGPFYGGRRTVDRRGLAVFEKARIDVVAKVLDGFTRDPRGVFRRDRRLFDEV